MATSAAVLLSVPKPHYSRNQSGAQFESPARARSCGPAAVDRPFPRSSGRSRGQLRESTPTTENNETKTAHKSCTHIHLLGRFAEKTEPGQIYCRNPGPKELVTGQCDGSLHTISSQAHAPVFLFFFHIPSGFEENEVELGKPQPQSSDFP